MSNPGRPPCQRPCSHIHKCNASDVKHELLQMNRELLFSFQELISALIDQPSSWSQRVVDISLMLRQMQHLLNTLRPHQVTDAFLSSKLS